MGRPSNPAGWTRRRWLQAAPACMALPDAGLALEVDGPRIAWPALTTVDGQALQPAHWQGVPAVVVFWATWCAYCRRHNVHVDRLYRSVDAGRLRVLGVALDADAALVRRYLQQAGFAFPAVADGAALRSRFTSRRMVPMTCTLGADGRLLQAIPGEMSEDDVLGLVRLALPPR
jgi:thiol-disulfide isomerase/thioredoxin